MRNASPSLESIVETGIVVATSRRTRSHRLEACLRAVGAATCIQVLAPSAAAECRQPPPIVRVQEGWLQGTSHSANAVEEFLAIPYAAPPVGALRWKPPAAPAPWRGVRLAETLPPRCAQLGGGDVEDCLYLNVYRPAQRHRARGLPVLFYIHGGALSIGYSGDLDPSELVASTETVVVTMNYRLGRFGFLALPALGEEAGDGTSGEYGLMDQQAALRWVHEQISAFGGDPQNVTIAGGSAGAFSVCAHLASPAVAGMFSRAVIQSGGCPSRSLGEAEMRGLDFARTVGCAEGPAAESVSCLRKKTAGELLASDTLDLSTFPISGGRLLPEAPFAAVAAGRFTRVPVLIGGVRDEVRVGLTADYPMTEATYQAHLNEWGALAPALLEVYPSSAYPDPFYAYSTLLNDSGVAGIGSCVTRRLARTFASYGPTYMYEFDDPKAPPPNWATLPAGFDLGSSHGSDDAYWFEPAIATKVPLDAAQRRLSREMIRYLGAFIERGAPEEGQQPPWPRFAEAKERVMRLRPHAMGVRTDFSDEHHCDFWSSLGF